MEHAHCLAMILLYLPLNEENFSPFGMAARQFRKIVRWADHAAVAALAELAADDISIEHAVQMFAKLGHWSRHAGPAPGMLGCRASPELPAQAGY